MSTPSRHAKHANALLETRGQSSEHVHAAVDEILKLSGCLTCGRLAILRVDFISDPPPDAAKNGIISLEQQGF